jgi:hypothetical protein
MNVVTEGRKQDHERRTLPAAALKTEIVAKNGIA